MRIVTADSPYLSWLHHHLRFRVYCQEKQWEDPQKSPQGLESDDLDPVAYSYLVYKGDAPIGVFRIIPASFSKYHYPEISRFMLLPEHRGYPTLVRVLKHMLHVIPFPCCGLMAAEFAATLQRLGVELEPLGPPMQCNGERVPYLINFSLSSPS